MDNNQNNNYINNFDNMYDYNNTENDSYYANKEQNNYSDKSYEEKKKKGLWWKILLFIIIIIIIILLLLRFCGGKNTKSRDQEYALLTTKICNAAKEYIKTDSSINEKIKKGMTTIIKYQTLSDANLIEPQIKNPYYNGDVFSQSKEPKYYSMNNSVRLMVMKDGSINCELIDNANDVTSPILRLNGDAEIVLAVGTEYEDPGFVATDDYDGDITNKVVISGTHNPSKAGTYELTYTVQDAAGNVTTETRKLIYEEYANIEITLGSVVDSVAPQISLKGSNPYCLVKGTTYEEPGAVATDNVDGNITDRIAVTNKVTGNLMGAFRVAYKVEDSAGNEATAYRAVIVTTSCAENNEPENVINNAPTLTLVGKSSVTIAKGSEYLDLGATAYDKEDGDITGRIVTDASGVNVNSAGVYKVIYRVTDSDGDTSSITRTVTVKQDVSGTPLVRFTGDKTNIEVYVGEGDNLLLELPKAINEYGTNLKVTTTIEDYATKEVVKEIDWNKEGKYRVTFTAIHGNGVLKQTKSIVVTIKNNKVEIGGKDSINVGVRSESCDLTEADLLRGGVTFEVSGTNTPIVEINNNKDIVCKIGSYEVEVSAKVNDGEITKKTIKVFVVNGEEEEVSSNAPGKVVITGNSANPNNPYNTNGVWIGGAVTGIELELQATKPEGSEISYFEWSSDCNNVGGRLSKSENATSAFTWTTEGRNSVCIRAVSIDGVNGLWSSPVNLYIDRTGPTIEFSHTWKDGKDDWHNTSSLTLSYKSSDSESGLSHFEYTYDDVKAKKAEEIETFEEATGNLMINENTEPTRPELFVYVRAVDNSGNKGEWTVNPAYANMDTIKPNAPTITVSDNNTKIVKITANASDNKNSITNRASGVAKFEFDVIDSQNNLNDYYVNATIDNENPLKGTATFTVPVNGETQDKTYDIKVWTIDKAGNKSEQSADETVTVKPGKKVEEVKLVNGNTEIKAGDACQTSTLYVGKNITLTATPLPTDAEEQNVEWTIDNNEIATIDENGKITAKKAGETTVTAKIDEVTKTCKLTVQSETIQCNISNCSWCYSEFACGACRSGYEVDWYSGLCKPIEPEQPENPGNSDEPPQETPEVADPEAGGETGGSGPANMNGQVPGVITCSVPNCKTCSSANVCSLCNDKYELKNGQCTEKQTTTGGVCCACGGSQGVSYSWSESGSCGGSCSVTNKSYNNCKGTSRDEQAAYCKSKGKQLTCPSGFKATSTDAYGCKTCEQIMYLRCVEKCLSITSTNTCVCKQFYNTKYPIDQPSWCVYPFQDCKCGYTVIEGSCSYSCSSWDVMGGTCETVTSCTPVEGVGSRVKCYEKK